MAIAWGVLVPLAIGASLARNLLPEGVWFVMHRALNGLALLFNLVGFAIAIHLINKSTGPGQSPKHFQEIDHRTVGLVVFILAMMQAGVAFFRPSSHHQNAPNDAKDETENTQDHQVVANTQSDSNQHNSSKSLVRTAWELKHRFVGAALIALSWYNIHTGIDLYTERFGQGDTDVTLVFWVVVGAVTGLLAVATVLSKSRK